MHGRLIYVALLTALASCGAKTGASKVAEERDPARLAKIDLTSDAFQDGQAIPARFSCDGSDQSPALSWGEPPRGTRSFALVMDDPDAPGGTFEHWGVSNIPGSARSIAAGAHLGRPVTNGFGKVGYGAPCPPKGNGPHHYHFRLFALDTDRLDLGSSPTVLDVENAARSHALAEGELVGFFERK